MIKFIKPKNLNGAELLKELSDANIIIENSPLVDDNGDLWLNIDAKDKGLAEKIIAAHNGTVIATEPTIEKKLESVGLNLDDLKTALGL